ncbi:N-acetylmuramoyl-L-alanine amidase [Streptomyces tricolor]|nr:N-acetylmuramoyl-L-alanine amidase [Streptomyces tricolor]
MSSEERSGERPEERSGERPEAWPRGGPHGAEDPETAHRADARHPVRPARLPARAARRRRARRMRERRRAHRRVPPRPVPPPRRQGPALLRPPGRPAAHRAPAPPGWTAPPDAPSPPPRYDDKVVAVFVHHTDSPNDYPCADAPRVIRHLYAGQTGARHWDDIGYNFVVDRCGTIYEGRAGGARPARHRRPRAGLNHRTAGIAALGTFTAGVPVPRAMTDAIAALAAWKLGLADVDPRGRARLVSSSGLSRYRAGTAATPARPRRPPGRLRDQLPRRGPRHPPPGDPGTRRGPAGAGPRRPGVP